MALSMDRIAHAPPASRTPPRARARPALRRALWAVLAGAGVPAAGVGQVGLADTDSATVTPGDYEAGALHRMVLGARYRDLWGTPITVPVLDLDRFAGGLTPEDRGGTSQSIVLHMQGEDAREWHFRSVDKDVSQGLPHALAGTFLGGLIQDQTSALHPGAAFVVAPLMEAAGLLHAAPRLAYMPDHPRLGRFRDEFAGMLGMIVERPDEGEAGEVLFGGSDRIVGMDRMLEHLEESGDNRIVAEEFLAARLVDMLVGDTDRGLDQWRWARYGEEGDHRWRPIARDRDWAFVVSDGWLPTLVRAVYPKVGRYGDEYGSLSEYVFMSWDLDRRLLAGLGREAFDSVAAALQSALTDEVLDGAVDAMPPPFVAANGAWLASTLRSRRDALDQVAGEFYRFLATEVDIHVSDEAQEAAVERRGDGSVEVLVRRVGPDEDSARVVVPRVTYRRTFVPGETREVRLDLHGGDDRAVIRGGGPGDIVVRIEGGGDDDVLADSSADGRGSNYLYDTSGENEFLAGGPTHVDERPFEPPEASGGWPDDKIAGAFRDWGTSGGIAPTARYRPAAGVILGLERRWTRYGFRRVPYERRYRVAALLSTGEWVPGVEASARFRRENSPYGAAFGGSAIAYHTLRFYGFGNDTPEPADHESRVVRQEEYRAAAHVEAIWDHGISLAVGPFVRYTEVVDADTAAPFGVLPASLGADAFGQVGAEASLAFAWGTGGARVPDPADPAGDAGAEAAEVGLEELGEADEEDHDSHEPEEILDPPQPSVRVESSLGGSWIPALWDASSAFGEAHGVARARFRAPGDHGPELGLRLGGQRVWGGFPFHEAAYVGGLRSLRGFRTYRFAGESAAWGSLELGVPLFEMELLLRGRLGVFGLVDTGRVWVDGESPEGWHTGVGGGLSFRSLGRVVRLAVVEGEGTRVYVDFGWP